MNLTVEVLRIVISWPVCVFVLLLSYKKAITSLVASLIPGAKIKFTIGQFTVETSIPQIQQSVKESLGGKSLTPDQISLLVELSKRQGRASFEHSKLGLARPLRDAGLIRVPNGGFLQDAEEIGITPLGQLVAEAAVKKALY